MTGDSEVLTFSAQQRERLLARIRQAIRENSGLMEAAFLWSIRDRQRCGQDAADLVWRLNRLRADRGLRKAMKEATESHGPR